MPALPFGIFAFIGADRARQQQRVQEMARELGVGSLDSHHVEGAELKAAELLALCRQRPAQGKGRLIVVDDALRLDAGTIAALVQHAELIAQQTCLVLMAPAEPTARQPLSRLLAQAKVEAFPDRQTPAAKPFALAEALAARQTLQAVDIARDQLRSGREPVEILGMVSWQLQRWNVVRRLLDTGGSADAVAAAIGAKPWQVQRIQGEISSRPAATVKTLLERCWQVDGDIKTGKALPALAIEQLIVEICRA